MATKLKTSLNEAKTLSDAVESSVNSLSSVKTSKDGETNIAVNEMINNLITDVNKRVNKLDSSLKTTSKYVVKLAMEFDNVDNIAMNELNVKKKV